MNRSITIIIILFIAGVVINAWFFVNNQGTNTEPTAPIFKELQPSYTVIGLQSKIFDETGRLTHRVNAEAMKHFDQLGYVILQQPRYLLFDNQWSLNGTLSSERARWQITADEAVYYQNQRLELENNVLIRSLRDDQLITHLSTAFLNFDLKTGKFESQDLVQLRGTDYVVSGQGINGDLRDHIYRINKHVQTQYFTP